MQFFQYIEISSGSNQETGTEVKNNVQNPDGVMATDDSKKPSGPTRLVDLNMADLPIIYEHYFVSASPPQTLYTGAQLQNVSDPRLFGDVKTHQLLLVLGSHPNLVGTRRHYRHWIAKPISNEHVFILEANWTRANIMSWQPTHPIDQYERVTVAVSLVGHLGYHLALLPQTMQDIQDFIRRFTCLRPLEVD